MMNLVSQVDSRWCSVRFTLNISLIWMENAAKDPSSLADQRDFSAFMNCEAPGKLTVEERVRLGPLPRVSTSRAPWPVTL